MSLLIATYSLCSGIGCVDSEQSESGVSSSGTSTTETSGSTTALSEADAGSTDAGVNDTSSGDAEGGRSDFEEAAEQACAVRDTLSATPVPNGRDPYLVTGFRMGNDFPQRFVMDSTSPDIGTWPGDYVCYDIGPPQDFEGDWWFAGDEWLEEDGEIHVFMVTQGIDAVVYYGSDEPGPGPDIPGAPETASIGFDASAVCPELPNVWIPDIEGHPENARRICMHHSTPIAEATFVRLP